MQIGLVGMPGAGKTTLLNLLTGSNQSTGLGGGDEVYTGSAIVPDRRIDFLSSIYNPRKTTYARIEFKDIPGARMDDSKNRASRLLDEVRSADALVQVLRVFNAEMVEALHGQPDPYNDLKNYGTELLLADIDALEKRVDRLENSPKVKKDDAAAQLPVLKKLIDALENELLLSSVELTDKEKEMLAGQSFLTEKPLFLLINIDENQLREGSYPDRDKILAYAAAKKMPVVEICAQVEMEISRLKPEERAEFLEDLDLQESGLGRLARMTYEKLNLSSYFTVGEDEVRAWTIQKDTPARRAAGKIHSDIERGFIRAEVFQYDHLHRLGSAVRVKEAGLFRLEGKEYPVQDGDIVSFRFNV